MVSVLHCLSVMDAITDEVCKVPDRGAPVRIDTIGVSLITLIVPVKRAFSIGPAAQALVRERALVLDIASGALDAVQVLALCGMT